MFVKFMDIGIDFQKETAQAVSMDYFFPYKVKPLLAKTILSSE